MVDRKKTTEEIIEIIYSLRRSMVSEMQAAFKEIKISHPQWVVLHYIHKDKDSSIKDIAEFLGITSSAVTQLVDGLVDKGLVTRKRNKEDRRILDLNLSGKALKQFELFKKRNFIVLSEMFSSLDDSELEEYLRLNKKITESIIDRKGEVLKR